jgi:hypothetical protein
MVTETHSAKWSDRWNLISTISGVVATPRFASQTACAPGSGGEQLPRGLLPQPLLHAAVQLGETATFPGASALLILLSFYVLPFVLSAIWSARHLSDSESNKHS